MNSPRQEVSAPTRELAGWIAHLRHSDLPARTKETVRLALLDTLGCGVYGHATPWAKMLLQWARAGAPARGEATVWGETAPSLRAADAALVNGTATHAFELDDTTTPSCTRARWSYPRPSRWRRSSTPAGTAS